MSTDTTIHRLPSKIGNEPNPNENVGVWNGANDSKHLFYLSYLRKYLLKNCLVLQIGCGDGDFLLKMANLHKDVNFTGCDSTLQNIEMARAKAAELGLKNVEFITLETLLKLKRKYSLVVAVDHAEQELNAHRETFAIAENFVESDGVVFQSAFSSALGKYFVEEPNKSLVGFFRRKQYLELLFSEVSLKAIFAFLKIKLFKSKRMNLK